MKLYDKIYDLLKSKSEYRNSDRKLIWAIWDDEGLVSNSFENGESIDYYNFVDATSPESIRRMRQKIVEKHPELQSDKKILALKKLKESTKGDFVWQEEIKKNLESINNFDQEVLF